MKQWSDLPLAAESIKYWNKHLSAEVYIGHSCADPSMFFFVHQFKILSLVTSKNLFVTYVLLTRSKHRYDFKQIS